MSDEKLGAALRAISETFPARATAIVDTNVLFDIYSCTDLVAAMKGSSPDTLDRPDLIFRRARARESLLLACSLHEAKTATWSLADESVRQLLKQVPPAIDEYSTYFTTWVLHFIKDYALADWDATVTPRGDRALQGSECDDLLILVAQKYRLPLITNEGYGPKGIDESNPKKLRAKARAARVQVYTPREFWTASGLKDKRAARRLFNRIERNRGLFLRTTERPEVAAEGLETVLNLYRHFIYGCTPEPGRHVRVEL